MMTSIRLGGSWTYEIISGIMLRDVADLPTTTFEFVASLNIQISKYTDAHDVDEDKVTMTIQGERYSAEFLAGIMHRHMYNAPTDSLDGAASRCKNKD